MRSEPSAAVLAAMKRAVPVTNDKLDRLRDMARELRDKELELAAQEERLKETQKRITEIQGTILPQMFGDAGVDHIGLPAEGNLPAADYFLTTVHNANIAASWSEERRADSFAYLESVGLGDIIKRVTTVQLGKGDSERAKKLEDTLTEMRIPHETKLGVHRATLTAVLREQSASGKLELDLEKIGGTILSIVKRKER